MKHLLHDAILLILDSPIWVPKHVFFHRSKAITAAEGQTCLLSIHVKYRKFQGYLRLVVNNTSARETSGLGNIPTTHFVPHLPGEGC